MRSLASELRSRGYRKLFLAGLSNGGVGATELAIRDDLKDELDGVILLFGAHPHIERVTRPTLLVFGDADERFTPGYFRWLLATPAATLRVDSGQIKVQAVHGDHFYLLREPNKISSLLSDWIAGRISDGEAKDAR